SLDGAGAAYTVIVAGAAGPQAPQRIALVGAGTPPIGTVVVDNGSGALVTETASYGTVVVSDGANVAPGASIPGGVVSVDTLVLNSTQRALPGAQGTLRAQHCQLASQLLDWPRYIDCGGRTGTLPV